MVDEESEFERLCKIFKILKEKDFGKWFIVILEKVLFEIVKVRIKY